MSRSRIPSFMSADEAVSIVQSGYRVYLHEVAMTPVGLVDALCRRAFELTAVETVSIHTEGPAPYVDEAMEGHIRHNALFVGKNVRQAVNDGRADFTPVFLSEVPALMSDGRMPIDVALL